MRQTKARVTVESINAAVKQNALTGLNKAGITTKRIGRYILEHRVATGIILTLAGGGFFVGKHYVDTYNRNADVRNADAGVKFATTTLLSNSKPSISQLNEAIAHFNDSVSLLPSEHARYRQEIETVNSDGCVYYYV